jgi:hypothetical protein
MLCLNEKCSEFCLGKYLSDTFPIPNGLTQLDEERRLILGNACYHTFQNLLTSHLQFKNVRIRILPSVPCGYETWSLMLRV